MATDTVLDVRGLTVQLPWARRLVSIVRGIDYTLRSGEILGIAGESGSGKTISMLAVLGLLPPGSVTSGCAYFGGRDLLALSQRQLRPVRGREISMVFQDPTEALHPMLSVGRQLTEHMRLHLGLGRQAARNRAAELLDQVRIPNPRGALDAYPHQFSGGMKQRIAIAIALACDPKVVIADEPTTGLDVTVQASILSLLDRLRMEIGISVIFVTHDLGVLSSVADRVAIFYAGRIVEEGGRGDLLGAPRHPYTRGLLGALPDPARTSSRPLIPIPSLPPSSAAIGEGCPFAPRCSHAAERCSETDPPLIPVGNRRLACHVDPYR